MSLSLHLKIVGVSLLLLSLAHAFFPKRFQWKEELVRLSLLNRQIFGVHCFFVALVLFFFGVLSLCFTEALLEPTALARPVLAGLALFWAIRFVVQLFVYDRRLWKGDRFNTRAHVVFTLLWTYYAVIYGWAFWGQVSSG
jgi:hypothetical protein